MIIVKNKTNQDVVWCGQGIDANGQYTLFEDEISRWAANQEFILKLYSQEAVVNNGSNDIPDPSLALDTLKGFAPSVVQPLPFASANGFRARNKGYSGVAQAGTTTDIDFQITEERYISAVQTILSGHAEDDTLGFLIVDKNGLYSPAGSILDVFAETWNVDHTSNDQGVHESSYPARLYAGLFVRIRYTSTGSNPVKVKVNFFLHKKT
jgi:hypothetical protein